MLGASAAASAAEQTAVFAGGCFWGVDAVFKHVRGVTDVVSGYADGNAASAHYDQVSNGDTGHAEVVRVRFNPAQISYPQLLQVFVSVAHDPTQLNRQGNDVGSQYRSAIFYTRAEQQKQADVYLRQLALTKTFSAPIVTQLVPLQQFFRQNPIIRTIWHGTRMNLTSCTTTCRKSRSYANSFRRCISNTSEKTGTLSAVLCFQATVGKQLGGIGVKNFKIVVTFLQPLTNPSVRRR